MRDRFCARSGIKYKRLTHKSCKTDFDCQQEILTFLEDIHLLRQANDVSSDLIVNIDETAVYFDNIPSYSYEIKEVKHLGVKVSETYKKRLTACLGITALGEKLRSLKEKVTRRLGSSLIMKAISYTKTQMHGVPKQFSSIIYSLLFRGI